MSRLALSAPSFVVCWAVYCSCMAPSLSAEPPAADDLFRATPPVAAEREESSPFEVRADSRPPEASRRARPTDDPTSQLEAKIRAALGHPTRMEFVETPLQDVIQYLRDLHNIQIQLDTKALSDEGSAPEQLVTFNIDGVALDSALRLLLDQLDLTTIVRDGVLVITTKHAAERMVELRVYDVSEITNQRDDPNEVAERLRAIFPDDGIKVIPFRNLLIVQASQHTHQELTELLEAIQAKLKPDDAALSGTDAPEP